MLSVPSHAHGALPKRVQIAWPPTLRPGRTQNLWLFATKRNLRRFSCSDQPMKRSLEPTLSAADPKPTSATHSSSSSAT